ncbi:PAQR family membrane homeostasis protein TrhA [Rubrivirga sp.]|uniref:PAQR family membrane homeostasis protein TrhA n=1 Tax=Rubrivirga sp. TaxID=1885344 RepID=UPI003C76F9E4
MSTTDYSFSEELASAITHGFGAVASICAGAVLVTLAALSGDVWAIVGTSVFVGTLILLYTASTLYHAVPPGRAKVALKTFDHCAIFALIAGTYTPFLLGSLRGPWGWSLFAVVWALAAAGIVFKLFFTGRFKLVSTLIYVGMGWLIVVATGPMRELLAPSTLAWLVGGGLAYTLGTVFYMSQRRFAHAVWHGFVMAGSACHVVAAFVEVLHLS